ncbi:MAG: T9SS type A sorting domain-containing protein [Ignavibacteriae bacterium]|nr:T9SS type A sorting domain-containing protein [Ignavibacteriota bacterium]
MSKTMRLPTTLVNHLPFRLLILLLAACAVCGNVEAQTPDTLWTRTFGGSNIDVGYSVQQTRDGGYVIAGYTRSFGSMSGRNVWLVKTDQSGSRLWSNAFGGDADDEGYAVQQTADGGYVIAGYTKSNTAGGTDMLLMKADTIGNIAWLYTFGGAQDDEAYAVQQTRDGGFIVAGATSSFGAGSRDVWLLKTNGAGSEVWRKTLGGFGSDGARSVQQTPDGGYIITGWTYSHGPGAVGNVWLVKTDSLGNAVWNKFFGGNDVDRGLCVEQTRDGGFVLTGYTSSSGAGLDDLLLIKTDSAGNAQWTKTFGGTGRDYGNSVQQTSDGGYIVAGYTLSFGSGGDDVWLIKTDLSGNQTWGATYGGSASDVGYSVKQTSDGGYIVTGHTLSYGAGVHDVWLIKIAPGPTSTREPNDVASEIRLEQNYPNPFNPRTTIKFQLREVRSRRSEVSHVVLKIFDVLGRDVATLVNEELKAGSYERVFDASVLASGVYMYQLRAGNVIRTRKLVVLR